MADDAALRFSQRTALAMPPLILRLVLAATFIWAGFAKVFGTMEVTDANRPALVAAGVLSAPTQTPIQPDPPRDAPPADQEPDQQPDQTPPDRAPQEKGDPLPEPIVQPAPPPPADQPPADPDAQDGPQDDPQDEPQDEPQPDTASAGASVALVAQVARAPAETVAAANRLALLLHKAGNPPPPADPTVAEPMPLVPKIVANPPWTVRLAWAAAIVELAAGVFLLAGFLTRLSALAVAGVMLAAMWLTEVGPAIQAGDALLGFLPNRNPWDVTAYATLLWQLALLGAALAVVFAGPGALALDRVLFGGSSSRTDEG